VPTIGSCYLVPPCPTDIFPFIFAVYMVTGGAWLFVVSGRRGILSGIAARVQQTAQAHEQHAVTALVLGLAADAEA